MPARVTPLPLCETIPARKSHRPGKYEKGVLVDGAAKPSRGRKAIPKAPEMPEANIMLHHPDNRVALVNCPQCGYLLLVGEMGMDPGLKKYMAHFTYTHGERSEPTLDTI